jgi:hypothetical protein
MPFKIIKKRFLRKLDIDGIVPLAVLLAILAAISVALCLRHQVVMGILVIPVFAVMGALQMLLDEHTERKEERELAERRKKWDATAHHRAYAKAIVQALRACPADTDAAYRERVVKEADEKFRSTCDKPLPEFLGAQFDGHFVPASSH